MKLLPIIFVIAALMVVMAGCVETLPTSHTPVSVDKEYTAGFTGEVNGTVHYQVMIVDDSVDTQLVYEALQYVPGWIEFEIVEPDNSAYKIETANNQLYGMHIPQRDNLIIMFDGDRYKPNIQSGGAAYICDGNGRRISCGVFDVDNAPRLGYRVFHEALHCEEYIKSRTYNDADEMDTSIGYRINKGSFTEIQYYMYLMAKYRGDT